MSDSPAIAGYVAIAIVAVRETGSLIKWLIERDKHDAGGNGKSGEKPPSFWELTFQRIVRDCLKDHDEKVRRPDINEATEERKHLLHAVKAIEHKIQDCDTQSEKRLSRVVVEITRIVREKNNR